MAVIETSKKDSKAGVYKHPETGAVVVIQAHPKFGTAQADGFVAAGFVWQGEEDKKTEEKKGSK